MALLAYIGLRELILGIIWACKSFLQVLVLDISIEHGDLFEVVHTDLQTQINLLQFQVCAALV